MQCRGLMLRWDGAPPPRPLLASPSPSLLSPSGWKVGAVAAAAVVFWRCGGIIHRAGSSVEVSRTLMTSWRIKMAADQ